LPAHHQNQYLIEKKYNPAFVKLKKYPTSRQLPGFGYLETTDEAAFWIYVPPTHPTTPPDPRTLITTFTVLGRELRVDDMNF
jgi:hypothetical protein